MRTRSRRETRGVSRSKCGDLITACVPVSWAASIIISESTGASDFYDGFGAAETTVGIRADRWGQEYYYPKAVDLNYAIKPPRSHFIGNPLKYVDSGECTLTTNNLWKFYRNKETDLIVTPAHLLLLPLDHKKILNFFNFKSIGCDSLRESSAFKRITTSSKTFNSNLVTPLTSFVGKSKQVSQLHSSKTSFNLSYNYGIVRQYNTLNLEGTTFQSNICIQLPSFDEMVGLIRYRIPSSQTISRFISPYITKPLFGTRIAEAEGTDSTIWLIIAVYMLHSSCSNDNQSTSYNSLGAGTTPLVMEAESDNENTDYTELLKTYKSFRDTYLFPCFPMPNWPYLSMWRQVNGIEKAEIMPEKIEEDEIKKAEIIPEKIEEDETKKTNSIVEKVTDFEQTEQMKVLYKNLDEKTQSLFECVQGLSEKFEGDESVEVKLEEPEEVKLEEPEEVKSDVKKLDWSFVYDILTNCIKNKEPLTDDLFSQLLRWQYKQEKRLNYSTLPDLDKWSQKIHLNNKIIRGINGKSYVLPEWLEAVEETNRLFKDVRPEQDYLNLANDRYVGDERFDYLLKYIDYCRLLDTHKSQCSIVLNEQCSFGKKYGIETIVSKDT